MRVARSGQWRYLTRSTDWSVMLNVMPAAECDRLIDGLRHPDPGIRALCIEIAHAATVHDLGAAAKPISDQLFGMSDDNARETAQRIVDSLAYYRYDAKYPWLRNFTPKYFARALKLLATKDDGLRLFVLRWFGRSCDLTGKSYLKAAERKLARTKVSALPASKQRDDALKALD